MAHLKILGKVGQSKTSRLATPSFNSGRSSQPLGVWSSRSLESRQFGQGAEAAGRLVGQKWGEPEKSGVAALQERLEELHKKEEKTRHKLEDTGVVLQDFCKTRGICDGA